jgi:hypothetical protein
MFLSVFFFKKKKTYLFVHDRLELAGVVDAEVAGAADAGNLLHQLDVQVHAKTDH